MNQTSNQVLLYDVDPGTAIDMKHELEQAGLIMNHDFTWHYQKEWWDDFAHEAVQRRHVKFEFANPAMATYYQLKWTL